MLKRSFIDLETRQSEGMLIMVNTQLWEDSHINERKRTKIRLFGGRRILLECALLDVRQIVQFTIRRHTAARERTNVH